MLFYKYIHTLMCRSNRKYLYPSTLHFLGKNEKVFAIVSECVLNEVITRTQKGNKKIIRKIILSTVDIALCNLDF